MKILESAPSRYDAGIRMLTLGQIDRIYERIALLVEKDQKVLDIGCGTGALSLRSARRGAFVKGIDVNSEMLEVARRRAKKEDLQNITFEETGIAEMEKEGSDSYDVVMSGLCFSELSKGEIAFTLEEAMRILKPGGKLIIVDEVLAVSLPLRILQLAVRIPLVVITYLLTQTTTHTVKGLAQSLVWSGFQLESSQTYQMGTLIQMVARKPNGE